MKDGNIIHKGTMEDIIKVIDNKIYESIMEEKAIERIVNKYPIINVRQKKKGHLYALWLM